MTDLKTGILLWSQGATWPEMLDAAKRVDRLGYDHLWTWDHIYAIFGDPYQPIFEGWTSLAAWAMATDQTRLGLLVGANTFRNPGLTAKTARPSTTSATAARSSASAAPGWSRSTGRTASTSGSGFGQRLDWLDEAVGAMRAVLDGGSATSEPGGHYAFDDLRHQPLPIQKRLPIMIGGSGEKKTLRTVAKYADMWNAMGTLELMTHKVEVLRGHCDAVGRDIGEIEFTLGVKLTIRDSEAEADRVWKAAMEHNRTPMADVEDDDTFWNGSPEQIADRLGPTSSLVSTPSSRSSPRRTTSRHSSASSARSSRSSIAARPQPGRMPGSRGLCEASGAAASCGSRRRRSRPRR